VPDLVGLLLPLPELNREAALEMLLETVPLWQPELLALPELHPDPALLALPVTQMLELRLLKDLPVPELLKLELRVALTVGVAEVDTVLFPLALWHREAEGEKEELREADTELEPEVV